MRRIGRPVTQEPPPSTCLETNQGAACRPVVQCSMASTRSREGTSVAGSADEGHRVLHPRARMTAGLGSAAKNLRSLTGLRAVAALLVVAHHGQFLFLPYDILRPGAAVGYVGVSFFYVLSGFVLTYGRTEAAGRVVFAWRRFSRIYPLYALAVLIGLVLDGQGRSCSLVWHLLALQAWQGSSSTECFNPVTWSLSDEAFFYFVFAMLAPLLRRLLLQAVNARPWLWLLPWLVGGVVAAVVAPVVSYRTSVDLLYLLPAYRLFEFVMGVLLALALEAGRAPQVSVRRAWAWSVGAYALATGCHAAYKLQEGRDRFFPQYWSSLLVVPAFGLLIVALARREIGEDRRAGWTGHPVMVRFGAWSYALYLSHVLVLHHLFDTWYSVTQPVVRALGYPAFVLVALLVAGAAHELVEAPIERWLRAHGPGATRAVAK